MRLAKQLLDVKKPYRDEDDYSPEEHALEDILRDYIEKHDPHVEQKDTQTAIKIATAPKGAPLLDDLLRDYEQMLLKGLTKHTTHERMRYPQRWRDDVGGSTPITALLDPDEAFDWTDKNIIGFHMF